MAEYIERDALLAAYLDLALAKSKAAKVRKGAATFQGDLFPMVELTEKEWVGLINAAPTADVVEVSELKEFAEDVVYQFGYKIDYNGRLHLSSGGLSTLEWAFDILGWSEPKPFLEGECEWDGCHKYASCGTPTPDGYKRVCGKHFAIIQAKKEAETVARMDGE